MKILFTRFPLESTYGGTEIQTPSLMKGLKERGHEVEFLGSCSVLLNETTKLTMKNEELRIGNPPVTKWDAISFLWRKNDMRRKLKAQSSKLKADAVFMLSLSEKILLTEYLAKAGTKVFWVEHDKVGRWLTHNPWLPAVKKASEHATIVCVSELSRRKYIELGFDAKRIVAIPNGIDLQRFNSSSSGGPRTSATVHVGCIARLAEEKGVDVLIHAISDIAQVDTDIVGTGPQEGYLRKILSGLEERMPGTSQRIRLHPRMDDLGDFYRSLDIFVLSSSEHDPFGLVAAEAMSMGIATIITDACGIAGYVERGKDAIVVQAGDPVALKKGIEMLLDADTRMRIGAAGKKTAEEKFGVKRMVDAYEKMLM